MTEIQKKNSIRHKAATFALALCTVLAGCTAPAVPTAGAVPAISAPVTVIQPEEQAVSAADLWSDDRSRTGTPLLDVPVAAETQWAIFEQCGQDASLFCAVMAIASVESGFDPQTVGDGGGSLGMMQINTRWHTGRMESLEAAQKELADLKAKGPEVRELTQEEKDALTAGAVEQARAEGAERIRALEKQLASADPNVAEFKVRFASWHDEYWKMAEVLNRIAQEDAERATRLRQAVKAELEQMATS